VGVELVMELLEANALRKSARKAKGYLRRPRHAPDERQVPVRPAMQAGACATSWSRRRRARVARSCANRHQAATLAL